MAAEKGNKYWEFRNKHGRDFKYTPDALWSEAVKYFDWMEANPLKEEKGFAFQGIVTKESFSKMRAMTLTSFRLFADICHVTWKNYKENKDFITVITRIEEIIYSQKFEGAAADLLNPNIIARDLGLKDESKHEIEIKKDLSNESTDELIRRANAIKLIDEQS